MLIRYICVCILSLVLVTSCDRGPAPQITWKPEFVYTEALVHDHSSVKLKAVLKKEVPANTECSFYYGRTKVSMSKIDAICEGEEFTVELFDLTPATSYVFKACVSNGLNMSFSDVAAFVTRHMSEPEPEPEVPEPEDPEPEDPELPVFEVLTTKLDISSTEQFISIDISANVDYDVIIPDGVDWLTCLEESFQHCRLSVSTNLSDNIRSCELIFTSQKCDCSYVVALTQQAMEVYHMSCPCFDFAGFLPSISGADRIVSIERIDDNGNILHQYDADDWCIDYPSISDGSRLYVSLRRNTTFRDRVQRMLAKVSSSFSGQLRVKTVLIVVTQYSPFSRIEFECEAVERRCVELWDTDSDGVLSFGEAEQVQSTQSRFTGEDITSFDEFQWFGELVSLADYMFTGTSIKRIVFPRRVRSLPEGIFMNCTLLRDVDLVNVEGVSKKAFMGCTSLENATLKIPVAPDQVFSGCVSLKTCTFKENDNYNGQSYIGFEAFSDCTSLQEISLASKLTEISSCAFSGCMNAETAIHTAR